MQSTDANEKKKALKRRRSLAFDMPVTDPAMVQPLDDSFVFPVEEIVQYPLPGFGAPTLISFSPDDSLVAFLFSPDQSLNRKLFVFDLKSCKQELFFSPPDGGLEENNLSAEEKLRRERSRERGLGVTRYEWVKTCSKKKTVMVPLPIGIYIQDLHLQPELKIPSVASSPIIDPHVSPDGTMLAYVRDSELHVLNLLYNDSKQLTSGADGINLMHGLAEYIAQMDNRGTARRGLKFEGALKYNCGHIDAEDQLSGAEWLIKNGLAHQGHVGLYGWSYGGYLSAMSLARFPEVFRCAVAGAPVTSWDGYDTFYTEKYMGLPPENPSGYLYSSVMHHVEKIKGKLLLVHGMIDENVHFRHTARLVNALVAAGKPYELLIFPDERHLPRRLRDRIYMEERIWDFIEGSL